MADLPPFHSNTSHKGSCSGIHGARNCSASMVVLAVVAVVDTVAAAAAAAAAVVVVVVVVVVVAAAAAAAAAVYGADAGEYDDAECRQNAPAWRAPLPAWR